MCARSCARGSIFGLIVSHRRSPTCSSRLFSVSPKSALSPSQRSTTSTCAPTTTSTWATTVRHVCARSAVARRGAAGERVPSAAARVRQVRPDSATINRYVLGPLSADGILYATPGKRPPNSPSPPTFTHIFWRVSATEPAREGQMAAGRVRAAGHGLALAQARRVCQERLAVALLPRRLALLRGAAPTAPRPRPHRHSRRAPTATARAAAAAATTARTSRRLTPTGTRARRRGRATGRRRTPRSS